MFGLIKRRKKRPSRRYVYLMERVSNRDRETIKKGRREIKIGIAKNPIIRHNRIDLGIPGRVVILERYKVDQASRVESFLHKKYKKHNFTVKGAKKGSGATEFHRLTNRDIRDIRRYLKNQASSDMPLFLKLTIWGVLLYGIIQHFTQ